MSIYIALHKPCDLPKLDHYIPIQVGAALHPAIGCLADNREEDHISEKNSSFCELTALYYIWKHTKDDVVGLVHYRRFFFKKKYHSDVSLIVDYNTLRNAVDTKAIVLPQKHYFRTDNYHQYLKLHKKEDLDLCREIVAKLYPEDVQAFQEVMDRSYIYPYNMFVMTRENFDSYMEWMFSILFNLEKQIDISDYDDYNRRIFGFLSERLLNIWVLKKKLKIVSYPVYNTADSFGQHLLEEMSNTVKQHLK